VNEDGYSLSDFAGLLGRRGKSIILVTLAVALLSIVITYSIEDLYRSTGTIVIEDPEVSQSFLPGTYQSPDQEQRIARINDGVMTRDNLLRIVEKHNLYVDDRKNGSAGSVVGMLRRNVELDMLLSEDDPRTRDDGEVIGFKVSYYHPEPDIAKAVARDIVELYLSVNKERRQEAYVETAAALAREAENLSAQVSRYESALADFKTKNPGALPEDRNYNRAVIERKARDLDSLDREIRSLQERKTILQSQLAQTPPWIAAVGPDGQTVGATSDRLRTLEAEYLRLIGVYSEDHPDVQRVKREIAALSGGDAGVALRQAAEAQLAAKRIELADARTQYGPNHPDVVNLSRSIAKLQEQIADLPDGGDGPPPNNPTYVNLELQLRGVNTELDALRADKRQLESQTVELDRKAQVAPEVERQYLELTRDLDLARQQYRDIKAREMAVERAGVLEEEELSERYVVTQKPGLPYEPAFPNRPLFIAIGLFLAVTIGLAFGMSAEAFDGSVRTTRDVRMILEMPPIAAIPVIRTAEESRKVRMANLTYAFGSAVLVIAVAIYVYVQSSAMM
jgi:succinoglycan biosynthesis transport protein ExoP